MSNPRLTIVVSNTRRISWNGSAVLQLDSLSDLQQAIHAHDVERIIIDRSASADEFLRLLAALPGATAADVVSVREDGGAFLSATGRGGDRMLYELSPSDVDFYLRTNELEATPAGLRLIA